MNPIANGNAGLHDGANRQSVPPRIIALGFYDGPTNGAIRFADGTEFRFDLTDESDLGSEGRTFSFAPLPAGSFDRLAATISAHIPPQWPTWVPIWRFPTTEIQRGVEAETDAILAEAGPPLWVVDAVDYYTFTEFRATQLPNAQPA